MCGRPAVPNISAMPNEMAEIGSLMNPPGDITDSPIRVASSGDLPAFAAIAVLTSTAWANSASGLKPYCASTMIAMKVTPASSMHALMICAGGGRHAAEQHVDHHQRADDDDRHPVVETEQQLDELPRAHHLRDQVERHHHQRADRGEAADRPLLEAIARDVGEGELAEVAQPLGHQERDDRPADQEADRVDQAVSPTSSPPRRCRGRMPPTCSRPRSPGRSGTR